MKMRAEYTVQFDRLEVDLSSGDARFHMRLLPKERPADIVGPNFAGWFHFQWHRKWHDALKALIDGEMENADDR